MLKWDTKVIVREDWGTSKVSCILTKDGRYRRCKITPTIQGGGSLKWGACYFKKFKKGDQGSWLPCETDNDNTPKYYKSEDEATQACEAHAAARLAAAKKEEKVKEEKVEVSKETEKTKKEEEKVEKKNKKEKAPSRKEGEGGVLSGNRGLRSIAIEAAMTKEPQTVAEITAKCEQKAVYGHMRWLEARDLVVRVGKGWAIK